MKSRISVIQVCKEIQCSNGLRGNQSTLIGKAVINNSPGHSYVLECIPMEYESTANDHCS
jgi:hypothetical protein